MTEGQFTPQPEELRQLVMDTHRANPQQSRASLARMFEVPESTVRRWVAQEIAALASLSSSDTAPSSTAGTGRRASVVRDTVPTLTLQVPIPAMANLREGKTVTALLYGDTHFPHQDNEVLDIVRTLARDLQPDVLVHMGDMLDCYGLSRFDKDPSVRDTLQDEIDQARIHLAQMRMAAPDARFVLLEGNHEDRLRRTLWGLQESAAVLGKLTSFQKAMTWQTMLGLEELHIEFVPYGRHSQFAFLPKFLLKHGDQVRPQSAYTARAELDRHNRSGASGHTHRLGAHFRRDFNGGHVWVETGCTCQLNPQYVSDPNWQNGCVVLTFDTDTGAVSVELVEVRNGVAKWRDKTYTTRDE